MIGELTDFRGYHISVSELSSAEFGEVLRTCSEPLVILRGCIAAMDTPDYFARFVDFDEIVGNSQEKSN